MKPSKSIKIISVLSAVLLLIAAMSIPAYAAEGNPTTYKITIESGSDVYTPDPSEVTVNAGDTYTFSIPDDLPTTLTDEELGEYAVEFSCWRFTGEFEVVQGTVNEDNGCLDKTVTLKPLSDLNAVACFIEDNAAFNIVTVKTNNPAYESYIEQGECIKGDNWTFSVPDELEGFVRWEFTGKYKVVEGSVDENGYSTDRTVVLTPESGITAFARFDETATGSTAASEDNTQESVTEAPTEGTTVNVTEDPTEEAAEETVGDVTPDEGEVATPDEDDSQGKSTPDQNGGNNSKKSPGTGDTLPLAAGIMALAAVMAIISVKKIRE